MLFILLFIDNMNFMAYDIYVSKTYGILFLALNDWDAKRAIKST